MRKLLGIISVATMLALPSMVWSDTPDNGSTHIHLTDKSVIDLHNSDIDSIVVINNTTHLVLTKNGSFSHYIGMVERVEFNTPLFDVPAKTPIGADATQTELHFYAEKPWEATVVPAARSSVDWLSIEPEHGDAGDNTIRILTTQNTSGENRTAQIVITSDGTTRSIDVTQHTVNPNVATLARYWYPGEGFTVDGDTLTMTRGNRLSATLYQTATFTDANLQTVRRHGEHAHINITMPEGFVMTDNPEKYNDYEATGSISDGEYAMKQSFRVGDKSINVQWSHNPAQEVDDHILPFYRLGEVSIAGVTAEDVSEEVYQQLQNGTLSSDGLNPEKTYTFHKILIEFEQPLTSEGATQREEATMKYLCHFITAQEIQLVAVSYEPGAYWVNPHDNLILSYYPYVDRFRHYSDGSIRMDRFSDFGHIAGLYNGDTNLGNATRITEILEPGYHYKELSGVYTLWENPNVIMNGYMVSETIGDSIYNVSFDYSILNAPSSFRMEENHNQPNLFWAGDSLYDWSKYTESRMYTGFDTCADVPDISDTPHEKDNRKSGFYFNDFTLRYEEFLRVYDLIEEHPDWGRGIYGPGVTYRFYDQFLVIDGRRIDFKKIADFKHDETVTATKLDNGYCRELKGHYTLYGKHFRYNGHYVWRSAD